MQSLIRSKSAGVTGGRGTAGAGPGRDILLQSIEKDFIRRGEYLQALRFVMEESDQVQLEINHYDVVNDHNQGISAKGLEELQRNLQDVTRVHHSDVSTFRVELEQCQHAIGEMHRASASYVSHVSFPQLGKEVDTIEHQPCEPFGTVKAFPKFTTEFLSMQGKSRCLKNQ